MLDVQWWLSFVTSTAIGLYNAHLQRQAIKIMAPSRHVRESPRAASLWSYKRVLLILVLMAVPWLPYITTHAFGPDWDSLPRHRVIHESFANRMVELDGKSFEDCQFENVTLMFHGTAPFTFSNVAPHGQIVMATDNKAIHNFEKARDYLRALAPKGAPHWTGEQDEKGNVFRYP